MPEEPKESNKLTYSERVDMMAHAIGTTLDTFDRSLDDIASAEKGSHRFGGGDSHRAQTNLTIAILSLRGAIHQIDHFTRSLERYDHRKEHTEIEDIVKDALRQVTKERLAKKRDASDQNS